MSKRGAYKDVIEKVLKEHPQTRNSDKLLLIWVWNESGFVLTHEQVEDFLRADLPTAETVRRTRQRFQQLGEYEADTKVKGMRQAKAQVIQQREPRSTAAQLGELVQELA